jgi:hypothetical protein
MSEGASCAVRSRRGLRVLHAALLLATPTLLGCDDGVVILAESGPADVSGRYGEPGVVLPGGGSGGPDCDWLTLHPYSIVQHESYIYMLTEDGALIPGTVDGHNVLFDTWLDWDDDLLRVVGSSRLVRRSGERALDGEIEIIWTIKPCSQGGSGAVFRKGDVLPDPQPDALMAGNWLFSWDVGAWAPVGRTRPEACPADAADHDESVVIDQDPYTGRFYMEPSSGPRFDIERTGWFAYGSGGEQPLEDGTARPMTALRYDFDPGVGGPPVRLEGETVILFDSRRGSCDRIDRLVGVLDSGD